ncbi:MAG: hypothetical protein M1828_000929 [Chrysothrix sp. TS-e1954]|nr:MAG: hypothetical protein M1828_000929 [Chrysothrix sp. TS-e1954]
MASTVAPWPLYHTPRALSTMTSRPLRRCIGGRYNAISKRRIASSPKVSEQTAAAAKEENVIPDDSSASQDSHQTSGARDDSPIRRETQNTRRSVRPRQDRQTGERRAAFLETMGRESNTRAQGSSAQQSKNRHIDYNKLNELVGDNLDFVSPQNKKASTSHTPEQGQEETPRTSVNVFLDGLRQAYSARDAMGGNSSSFPNSSPRDALKGMMMPPSEADSLVEKPRGLTPGAQALITRPPPFKLKPSLGKVIEVNEAKKMDVGRAFRVLNGKCSQEGVFQMVRLQRFHERPGLKRKRLRMSRWRRRFQESFRGTVGRVEALRRKGW